MPRVHRITIYRDKKNLWRWRVQAGNNRVIGASEQGYAKRKYAIKKALKAHPDAEVLIRPASADE